MPSNDLTLAITLAALERLARPKHALDDAETWASHVGIVSSEPTFVERHRVRKTGFHWDFLSGPRSIEEALTSVRDHYETERYVFVGTEESSEVVETVPEWKFLIITDAATAADWRVETTSSADDEWP